IFSLSFIYLIIKDQQSVLFDYFEGIGHPYIILSSTEPARLERCRAGLTQLPPLPVLPCSTRQCISFPSRLGTRQANVRMPILVNPLTDLPRFVPTSLHRKVGTKRGSAKGR